MACKRPGVQIPSAPLLETPIIERVAAPRMTAHAPETDPGFETVDTAYGVRLRHILDIVAPVGG